MAGFTTDEGETIIATVIHERISVDRDADLELGLFTNAAADETLTEAAVTEPTGGGYARKTLTDATWGITNDTADYAQQTFTCTGTDYVGTVYGYFVATQGTTARLLYVEIDAVGPYDINVDDTYSVTLNVVAG